MEAEYPLDKQVGQVLGIDSLCAWHQVSLRLQAVHHNPDGVATIRPWKAHHKVHADVLPLCMRDRE